MRTFKRNGHNTTGEANGNAKLTLEQVKAIRESNEKTSKLAEIFQVHYNTIYKIKSGERWAN